MLADEQEFLQRVRQLDEDALSELFSTYYPAIYRHILRHVGHQRAAEDMAAEVFRRLLDQLGRGSGPTSSLKAWMYRVAINLVVDDSRRQSFRQHAELDEDLAHDGPPVEEAAHQLLLAEAAQQALLSLTPKQRTVLVLRYLDGFNLPETAEIMGLAITAVKALQHRGLVALRRELEHLVQQGESV